MELPSDKLITREFLDENPNAVFVFGDNTLRRGQGGAAILRYHPQALGFITKVTPSYEDEAFYTPQNYLSVYSEELEKLKTILTANPTRTYLISAVGGGLANKFGIFEEIIEKRMKSDLRDFKNVTFLW